MLAPISSLTERMSPYRKKLIALSLFLLISAVGLFIVKWNPYYYKAFTAATEHSIGDSIIVDQSGAAPEPSWSAAWSYSVEYFKAIWKAMVLGIVMASLIQSLVPRDWFIRLFGKTTFGNTLTAGLCGMPSMMCTCCAAPVVVSMRKSNSSVGAAVAYWMSNTALNPAVLIFMTFVLSWEFTVLRIVLGLILVFGVSHLLNRISSEQDIDTTQMVKQVDQVASAESFFWKRWLQNIRKLVIGLTPAYIITVFILGAVRAWLFPAVDPAWSDSILAIVGFAIAGTLFVIPTAAEIPIVQTLQSFGLGAGPAAALMFTLPVISLPSAIMVSRGLSWRVISALTGSIIVLAVLGGLAAMWLL